MIHFHCVIQRDQAGHQATDSLEAGLRAVHAEHFEDEPITVSWQIVPPGEMFTEGRQSTSSLIGCFLTRSTTLPEREQFMRAVCRLWTDTTGCTDHEVVVAITETDPLAS